MPHSEDRVGREVHRPRRRGTGRRSDPVDARRRARLITVRGAREHNLRDVDIDLPRDRARRLHRDLGQRQVHARVRHHLRRGPAPLRRDAVELRPPVPRPDGQARRRLHRRAVAGDLDRPEVGVAQPAVDRRHDHRDLRLPAAPLRPDRRPALPDLRSGHHPPDAPADRRPGARAAEQGTRFQVLAPVVRGRKGEYEGLLEELPGQGFTRARIDGETVELADRDEGRAWLATSSTRSRSWSTGSCGEPGIERRLTDSLETALRLAEGVAEVEIVRREDEPAPSLPGTGGDADDDRQVLTFSEHLACAHCGIASTSWRPATSRSTRPTARANAATVSAPASRSIPSSWSPTTTCRSPTGRSTVDRVPRPVLRSRPRRAGRRVRLLDRRRLGAS